MPNLQEGKIILVDHTEVSADNFGSFLKIFELSGETHRLAEKRNQLWGIFQNARKGEPILAVLETYKGQQYISDARPITDEILRGGIRKLGEKLADQTNEVKDRSVALSYAVSLVVGGIIELDKLYSTATDNYQFIKGVNPDEKGGDKNEESVSS